MYSKKQRREIFTFICDLIVQGSSLRAAIVKINENRTTKFEPGQFFNWLREHEEFSQQYARATEERAQFMFEKMLDIADEKPEYTKTKFGQAVDAGFVQYQRVKIDTYKWAMSRMMPKKYGNNVDHEPKENNNLTVEVEYVDPKNDES